MRVDHGHALELVRERLGKGEPLSPGQRAFVLSQLARLEHVEKTLWVDTDGRPSCPRCDCALPPVDE